MDQAVQSLPLNYRPDIDGLRAIAVISVVIFHAFPVALPGGFIGVDVFFVISGYLISGILIGNLEEGSFRFAGFYGRRILRIFPALLLVLVFCFALGWFVLLADEFKQLGKHIAASAGFVQNFVLLNEAGYFDTARGSKPLLHLWSLGVEEQFYLTWPLFLWAVFKVRNRSYALPLLTTALALLSFVLNLKGTMHEPVATFFSPQTRFWELSSGSALAWLARYRRVPTTRRILNELLAAFGLSLLVVGFVVIDQGLSFPGAWALIPTVGAAALIAAGPAAQVNTKILSHPIAVWLGLISYPLYLWHWPLLTFLRILVGDPSWRARFAVVLLSVALGNFTWRCLEKPLRSNVRRRLKIYTLASLMCAVAGVGYFTYQREGFQFRRIVVKQKTFAEALEWNYWDDAECGKRFGMSPCQSSPGNLAVMILGDSHANHLFPGLVRALKSNVGVVAAGTCPPAFGMKLFAEKNQAIFPCAKIDYLSQNLRLLDSHPLIKTVILSSFWRPVLGGEILNAGERETWGSLRLESSLPDEKGLAEDELLYRGLRRTITEIRNRGRDIIFVRDTPDFAKDIRDVCLDRFGWRTERDCKMPRPPFERRRVVENRLVEKLRNDFPTMKVVDPFDTLCDGQWCFLTRDQKPLYRDQHHLSVTGSTLLGRAVVPTIRISEMEP